ncbi:MAG: acetylornithine deacetylase [Rhodobacteraceae bacterium]|nr:acetylornithine deacetylase [Paracoccaceae bacterium]
MTTVLTAREILQALVAFPTVSRDSNLPLIDWVEGYLAGHGILTGRQWAPDREKAGLFAHVGPAVAGGVVLSGHSDVVPVDGQVWATDPWTVTERDGRLYGRGTCDMKGFVALAIWALVEGQRRGSLTRPLQLALSYDEEVGCTGAPPLIAAMADLPRAQMVLVGEPSRMRVVTAHKGGAGVKVHVRGHAVHSSLLPEGVSAIMEAARLIGWANDQNTALQARTPSPLARLFHPPFTTLHTGMINGGTAHNITAADCHFSFECRVVPDESWPDWLERFRTECTRVAQAMQRIAPASGIDLDVYFTLNGLAPEADGAAEALARRLTGDNGTHVVSYGTEAGHFQAAGYSCVVCGPGDIAQAHQPDEYLEVSEFVAGAAFMEKLLQAVS